MLSGGKYRPIEPFVTRSENMQTVACWESLIHPIKLKMYRYVTRFIVLSITVYVSLQDNYLTIFTDFFFLVNFCYR